MEEVVDTMLHELCHNEIGPHNQKFHALWDQLRKEHEGLISKGYTGEGFLSDGRSLGGQKVPRHEARRLARIAAEKRQNSLKGSDQKLGGRPVPYGADIRKVIVDAIERRNKVTKGCGESRMNPIEIKDLADEATHNGFNTLAEEDTANDAAIAQAMWELVQEDQKKEYGDLYIPPSVHNPAGSSGGNTREQKLDGNNSSSEKFSSRPASAPLSKSSSVGLGTSRQPLGHVSRLVFENSNKKSDPSQKPKDPQHEPAQGPVYSAPILTGWTCNICTLHNPIEFLCCDACTTERPEGITKQVIRNAEKKAAVKPAPPQPQMWTCRGCSTRMEDQWWTCSTCGKMKESS